MVLSAPPAVHRRLSGGCPVMMFCAFTGHTVEEKPMSTPATTLNKVLYTAEGTVTGGRAGHGRTSDGRLEVDLAVPPELGGAAGPGTNPEQLFALGYAACFQSALMGVARRENLAVED